MPFPPWPFVVVFVILLPLDVLAVVDSTVIVSRVDLLVATVSGILACGFVGFLRLGELAAEHADSSMGTVDVAGSGPEGAVAVAIYV